jgi:ATP-dependent Clp protease ATP-binding subunit ClpA
MSRVIQEYIKKPLAEELLFGKLEHGGTARVLVEGEGEERKLSFEYLPADPAKAPRAKEEDEDADEDEDTSDDTLVGAAPKKALPGPKERGKDRSKPAGAVPSVPRRKDE